MTASTRRRSRSILRTQRLVAAELPWLLDELDNAPEPEPVPKGPNIYQRMLGVMGDLESVHKGRTARLTKKDGTSAGAYAFVSHNDVASELHPLMVKHGIYAKPTVLEWKMQGNTCELTLRITFINVDDPTDRDVQEFPGLGADYGDKATGKAVSYAYKLALLKAFMLESSDEDNEKSNVKRDTGAGKKPKPEPEKSGYSKEQVKPGQTYAKDRSERTSSPDEDLAPALIESIAKAQTLQDLKRAKVEFAKVEQQIAPKLREAIVKAGKHRLAEINAQKPTNGHPSREPGQEG